jgi:hypothetical protein
MDYFFGVLVRSDVLSRVSGVEASLDLSRYVLDIRNGDQFGTMKLQGREYFIHPGATTPTQFDFDAEAYFRDSQRSALQVSARIAPNVPDEAVKRGGAVVKLTLWIDGRAASEQIVKVGQPFNARLHAADGKRFQIVVDNNGSPDTDWLLLSIR